MGNTEKCKETLVQECAQCHTVEKEGKLKTGPILYCLPGWKTRLTQMPARTEASLWKERGHRYGVNDWRNIPEHK